MHASKGSTTDAALRSQDPEAFEREALVEDTPAPAPAKAGKKKGPLVVDAEDEDFQTVGVKGKTITISSEGIFKALAQVLEARGRKVRSLLRPRLTTQLITRIFSRRTPTARSRPRSSKSSSPSP